MERKKIRKQYFNNHCYFGDCRQSMRQMIADGVKVQMCVTSPPYYGLRSYMPDGVKLKSNAPEWVLVEIAKLGIKPIEHI